MQSSSSQQQKPKLKQIKKKPPAAEPSAPPSNIDEIQVGAVVEHTKFGLGKVISIEGAGPNKKATVHFNSVGQKQLLLRFARLRLI